MSVELHDGVGTAVVVIICISIERPLSGPSVWPHVMKAIRRTGTSRLTSCSVSPVASASRKNVGFPSISKQNLFSDCGVGVAAKGYNLGSRSCS